MFRKIFTIGFMALLIAAAPLKAATQDEASAAEWRRAESLMLSGKASEAYPIFVALSQRYPGHSSIRLGLARSAALTGRYDEAEAIYKDLLEKYPGDPTLLNERDQVLALKSGTGAATTVGFRVRAGFIYDSNANQGADSDVTQVFNIAHLFVARITFNDTKKIPTAGAYFGANFNIAHRLGAGPLSFVADSGLYIRYNENSRLDVVKNREWQFFRVGGGLRYAKGQNLFEARLKWEIFDYELSNRVVSYGPELTYLRAVGPKVHLITQAVADFRHYQRSPDRDGSYGQLAQYGRYFFGEKKHSVTVGGAYLWGRPKNHDLGYDGWSAMTRFTFRPFESWELSPFVSYIRENYKAPVFFWDKRDRRDKKIRVGLDAIYKINESWQVEFNVGYNRAKSTSPLYEYSQRVVSLGMSWGF
jgi:tetratricopeptide (TPR) repeat protein